MTSPTTGTADAPATIVIPTRLFGPLRVAQDSWINFPEGLLGFGGDRSFVLLPAAREGLYWMQDIGDSAVAFLVADPLLFEPTYAPELPLPPADELAVLCIVTLGATNDAPCSINLQAPLVIDFASRTGAQLLAANPSYATRVEIDLRAVLQPAG